MTGSARVVAVGPTYDEPAAGAWYALGVLTVVLLFATVDRAVLILLAQPVKESLGLSDLQLGLVQGTGIAVFAALATFPLGWLADKIGRRGSRRTSSSCSSPVRWSVRVRRASRRSRTR